MDSEKNTASPMPSSLKKLTWFTLVELIVVITILAILATIGFLALSGYSQDAKDAAIKANVRSLQTAISSESAITNNSPRHYVVHDTGAALSGAFTYVDENQVMLTGGQYGTAGTNYSAGNPDYAKLKLNPEKFKLSSLWIRVVTALSKLGSPDVSAAYDSKAAIVGALDATLSATTNGRTRSVSYFQVAGVAPATGVASVSGNFPQPTTAQISSGAVAGLVKNPTSSSNTGALLDGAKTGISSGSAGWAGNGTITVNFRWATIVGVPVETTWEAACQKCRDLGKRVIVECYGGWTNYVQYGSVPWLSYASNCMHNEGWATAQTTEKIYFPDKRTADSDACTTYAVTWRGTMDNYTYGHWSSMPSGYRSYTYYGEPNGSYYLGCY